MCLGDESKMTRKEAIYDEDLDGMVESILGETVE